MNHPVIQGIIYGLRRHWVALVFLLMSLAALWFGMQFSSSHQEAHKKAEDDLSSAQGSFVTDIPMEFKPVPENLDQADENLARIGEFFNTAKGVLVFDVNATYKGDFVRHLKIRIDELNDLAASNRVQIPNTTVGKGQTNRQYHFTFGHFQTNVVLPADQIEGLALALHDVRKIAGIFLTSNILELKGIQRTRMVQLEDQGRTGSSQAYTDDLKHYVNDEETLEGYPYLVTFVCYPETLASVLGRIATFPAGGNGIYITRNLKIESVSPGEKKKVVDSDDDGMGDASLGGGFGIPGGDPSGGDGGGGGDDEKKSNSDKLSAGSIDALAASGLGSKSARPVIEEQLLRVELHLDIIRGLIKHADGREDEESEEGF
ncbi:MAG: Amuc_1100 family pilus-like protein [Verrucomicrobiota bacterium]|jgi:hypothetical protein|nr:Amuc_1100 family pilus-like protein [Verrucomicrobiota bacterium]